MAEDRDRCDTSSVLLGWGVWVWNCSLYSVTVSIYSISWFRPARCSIGAGWCAGQRLAR